MSASSVYCHVIAKHVTLVTKLGGGLAEITCLEYEEGTGLCRLKTEATGRETGASARSSVQRRHG